MSIATGPTDTRQHEKFNQEFFDRWAENYDRRRITPWFRYTQELALKQLSWRPDGRLLDVGCGTGFAVHLAAARMPRGKACGIDISPAMIGKARANTAPEAADRIDFRQASAESIPYGRAEFDYVLCTNSFHHYQHPNRALTEMLRVLEPGGTLVIFENAPDMSPYTWLWDRVLRIFEQGHVRYYRTDELGRMIGASGFRDVELRLRRNEALTHGKLFASIQIWAARAPAREYSEERPMGDVQP